MSMARRSYRGGKRRTKGVLWRIPASSSIVSRLILSAGGMNSASTARPIIVWMSSSQGNAATRFAIRTSERVPSLRRFCTLSADIPARYLCANLMRDATTFAAHPVCASRADSSSSSMGCESTGKNMFVCSSESQSRRGVDFDAVEMMRKEGFAIERPSVSCRDVRQTSVAEHYKGTRLVFGHLCHQPAAFPEFTFSILGQSCQ